MQRETALALFGIGLVLLLLLVGVALHISSPPSAPPPSVEAPGVTKPSVSPLAPPAPTQTAAPVSPPALVAPTIPPPNVPSIVPSGVAIPSPPPSAPTAPTVVSSPPIPPAPSAVPSLGAAVPPAPAAPRFVPEPLPQVPSNEALDWARALVEAYQPRWQIRLTKSDAAWLGDEGFAVTMEPNGQVTLAARTPVGWLYGLLDLAQRLSAKEPLPAQWRWVPPIAERGLVTDSPDWLRRPPRSSAALRSLLRKRLRELAWERFNTWVLRCDGRERGLGSVLPLLRRMAPDYGVKIVVWSATMSPAVRNWVEQGGTIVSAASLPQSRVIAFAPSLAMLPTYLERGKVIGYRSPLLAPTLPSDLLRLQRRENLLVLVELDGAYRDMFWFDPAWAHQLVRTAKEMKAGGLWLCVSTNPSSWTLVAFAEAFKNPDANAEALWLQRWVKQGLPNTHAGLWLRAFREASRIIPELIWLGVSEAPQWGVPLPTLLAAAPIGSTWGREWGIRVLSVAETLQADENARDPSVLTMRDMARRLEQRAQEAWASFAQLPEPATTDWQRAKRVATMNAWLGQHYAHKIDASLAWARFAEGERDAGEECLRHLVKAVRAWEQLVAVANTVYPPNNRWAQALPQWQREVEMYRAKVAGAIP